MKTILSKIRLAFRKKEESYFLFYKILGFYPKKLEYYKLAIRHKSLPIKTKDGRELSNERLEFLGDAVLNSVVTDIIYHRFEDKQEGFLTALRAKIVSRESLNQIAKDIGLDKMVIATKYVNRNATGNIYGNALEALFGAIYLDYGYRKCMKFLEDRLFRYFLDWDEIVESEINYKSKLFELCHKNHVEPEFVLVDESVVRNKHTFRTCIVIAGNTICEGQGHSKKESQQNASRIAWQYIEEDPQFFQKINKSFGN